MSAKDLDIHMMAGEALARGSAGEWERLVLVADEFPAGEDPAVGEPWVCLAISGGNPRSVRWMLEQGVSLDFVTPEGMSPLHVCIESLEEPAKREEILELLLEGGAPVNLRGFNGWTPLHLAAVRGQLDSIRALMNGGADPLLRTQIDLDTTAEEEARFFG